MIFVLSQDSADLVAKGVTVISNQAMVAKHLSPRWVSDDVCEL